MVGMMPRDFGTLLINAQIYGVDVKLLQSVMYAVPLVEVPCVAALFKID